jgi:hypothetical protein
MNNNKTMLKYSIGNRKIGKNTLIINMGPAKTCPAKLKNMCSLCSICYAKKAERLYPQVLPYRQQQAAYWLKNSPKTIANDLLTIVNLKNKKSKLIEYIRFNEAGDFYTLRCLKKLIKIANIISQALPYLKIYTYTHRIDLIKKLDKQNITPPKNLIITLSNYQFKKYNSFIAIDKTEPTKNKIICPGDCSNCNLCKINHNKTIYVIKH